MKTPLLLSFFSASLGAALTFGLMASTWNSDTAPAPTLVRAHHVPSTPPNVVPTPPARPVGTSATPPKDFRQASHAALDAVVHIRTASRASTPQGWSFFGAPPAPPVQRGSGSGVILSEDGFIVTNHHVIDGADDIQVGLNDNRSVPATLVGSDPATDIAVLQIDAPDLTAISWGDSDALQVGDWVLAVGNPFDLTSTVTAGIVSAKARDIQLLRPDYARDVFPVESFIQTDAAVNPGNSGGALVDVEGQLVGINTAIASRTGSYAGYAFAVPANLARKVAGDLMEYGRVQRAYLGVNIRPVTEPIAEEVGLPEVEGVLVVGTTPGSGAEASGLKEGDVILRVGGSTTSTLPALMERVNRYRPGESTTVEFWRDGVLQKREVELRDRSGSTEMRAAEPSVEERDVRVLGARLQDASGDLGVDVVDPGSGAFARADIPAGTRITALDGQSVRRAEDVADLLRSALEEDRKAVLVEGELPNGQQTWFGLGLR